MNNRKGFSRLDIAVALACIAFILAEASILNAGGRERSKKEVCLANLRSLVSAWQSYSNDNSGKIPSGDVGYSWAFPIPQPAWVEWLHSPITHPMPPTKATNWGSGPGTSPALSYTAALTANDEIRRHAISEGTLWKYVGDYDIYQCPDGDKGAYVAYSMSMAMNTYPGAAGTGAVTITNINQIAKPSEKFVFLDTGVIKAGAFYVSYSGGSSGPGKWYDLPPMRHGQGTNFVFADGHAIYRQWTDQHTLAGIKDVWGGGTVDYCDCDLRWITKVTWGDVPYICTNPNKHCEF
jgi:prepilin-type processing-associated H-X9-DG protein